MTLILAIKARDGVLLAADARATSATAIPTQTTTRKLGNLYGRIAYGCSGSAGLRQRVIKNLEETISEADCALTIAELRPRLHAAVNAVQQEAVNEHVPIGDGVPAHVEFLFAGFSADEPWIYEVAVDGKEELHPEFEAIGDVRHYAVYGIVSHAHLRLSERRVQNVRGIGYRIIFNTMRTDGSGSVGGSIQLYEVTEKGAVEIEEQGGIHEALNAWQEQEHEIFVKLFGDSIDGIELASADGPPVGIQPDQL